MLGVKIPAIGSLVLVRWDDAYEIPPGCKVSDYADTDCMFETVGWLVSRNRRSIIVVPERGPKDTINRWRGGTRIPIGMIVDVTRICKG